MVVLSPRRAKSKTAAELPAFRNPSGTRPWRKTESRSVRLDFALKLECESKSESKWRKAEKEIEKIGTLAVTCTYLGEIEHKMLKAG